MAKKKKELSLEERVEKLEKDLIKKERSLKYYMQKEIKNLEYSTRKIETNQKSTNDFLKSNIDFSLELVRDLDKRKMNRLFRFKKKK